MTRKRKVRSLTKLQLKKATEDIEELNNIYNVFTSSDRPESLREFQEANRMAKWFNRNYKKYTKKTIFKRLPVNLQQELNIIDPDEVGELD